MGIDGRRWEESMGVEALECMKRLSLHSDYDGEVQTVEQCPAPPLLSPSRSGVMGDGPASQFGELSAGDRRRCWGGYVLGERIVQVGVGKPPLPLTLCMVKWLAPSSSLLVSICGVSCCECAVSAL